MTDTAPRGPYDFGPPGCRAHGEWWCPDCGEWINHGDTKAVGDFTVHTWCS